ncbi:hypothetical protein NDK47_22650 [Brevibacillus ruminantium]|uniref:Peptidase n=1 Tax=Brevibacillus ruminantium TaxID=2950604 RepID=A0ABY4WCV3_9BACL|nr:hypothetical protein [Brevibacillus ruminantium]USG64893.1 hypothetical protein NDK47_22650 [Brevibacillus ruminantium]
MDSQDDKDLFRKIRSSYDIEPRPDFLPELERKLAAREMKRNQRRRIVLFASRWGLCAAAVLLLINIYLGHQSDQFSNYHKNPETNRNRTVQPSGETVGENRETKVTKIPTSLRAGVPLEEAQLSQPVKQMLEKLYELFPKVKSATQTSVNLDYEKVYDIQFQGGQDPEKWGMYINIDRDSGTLLSVGQISSEQPARQEMREPSEAVAKAKAGAFLRDLLGTSFSQYRLDESRMMGGKSYRALRYDRYVNNIKVAEDGYELKIDGDGNVIYLQKDYHIGSNMDIAAFAAPADVLTKKEVEASLAKYLSLEYSPSGTNGTYDLIYPNHSIVYLDAKSGQEVKTVKTFGKKLSPAIPVKPGGKKVMAKTAEEAVAALAQFGVQAKGAVLTKRAAGESGRPGEIIYEARADGRYLRVTTAEDGRVVGFRVQPLTQAESHASPEERKLSKTELQEKALVFLQPYLDSGVNELMNEEWEQWLPPGVILDDGGVSEGRTIIFTRSHQGIPIQNQRYQVSVDPVTGGITEMSITAIDGTGKFADVSKAISPETAAAVFTKQKQFDLQYVYPIVNGSVQEQPVLVYGPREPDVLTGKIDALSGMWME